MLSCRQTFCRCGVMAESGFGLGLIGEGCQREKHGSCWSALACRELASDGREVLLLLVAIPVIS